MRSMSYNPAENALLINSDEEGGTYRFFKLAGGAPATLVSRGEVPETFSGQGGTAVFIARNRFAVWNRFASTIQVRVCPLLPRAAITPHRCVAATVQLTAACKARCGGCCQNIRCIGARDCVCGACVQLEVRNKCVHAADQCFPQSFNCL